MIIAIIYILLYAIYFALTIASYVFTAISIQTIAKRRGIAKPWLAWIPIADAYIWGSIADEFDSRVGISKNYRKKMLISIICAWAVLALATIICLIGCLLLMFIPILGAIVLILGIILLYATFIPLVFYYISYYPCLFKIFHSTAGDKVLLPFLLSMGISYAAPVCLFIYRNKEWIKEGDEVTEETAEISDETVADDVTE